MISGLNKKMFIGYSLILSGVVMAICMFFFMFFAHRFLNVAFEPDQTPKASSINEKITIPGFESMVASAAKKTAYTTIYNPEGNNCYFEVSIILKDGGKEIYKSKFISPGQHLYEIQFDKSLSAGTYKAVLHYSTYSLDNYAPMNGANIPFTLIVN